MSGLRSLPSAGVPPDRNDPCPCGSGLKYKKCCAIRPRAGQAAQARRALGTLTALGREVASNAMVNRAVREGPQQPVAPSQPAKQAPAQPPRELARHLNEAARLRSAGRLEEAIPPLRRAAQLAPNNASIRQDLGSVLLDCGQVAEAVDNLTAAIRIDPKLASAHYCLGVAQSRLGRVMDAIGCHRRATALAPKLADAHWELGMLLEEIHRNEEAGGAFDKAAAIAAGTARGREAAARALVARNQREEAIALLRRARALDPKAVGLIHLLAHTLIAEGRMAEAEQELMAALDANPRSAGAWYELSTMRKMTPNDRPLIERMTAVLRAGRLNLHEQALLHFALGKMHDDLREFEAAIGHFDLGNRIRAGSSRLDRKMISRTIDRRMEFVCGVGAGTGDAPASGEERPVFIVGMPRSGTTLAEQILSSHPLVAAGGELGFWSEHAQAALDGDADALGPDTLRGLAGDYLAVLRDISPDAARVTDKNPFNFSHLGLLRRMFPRAFIIHCRRHPVDTCLSMYFTYFQAVTLSYVGNRADLVFYYREYERLMEHWRKALPPDRFMEIDYEKLVSDREAETRRLISFCELPWDDACLRPERNTRTVATASVWQARQPVYRSSMERWRNYEPWLGPFAELMQPAEANG
jgi:tetratricopeptide (TPR) repeat protein